MFNLALSTPISFMISLSALAGVTLHDTKIDKLATTFSGIPAMMSHAESGSKGISNDLHTHVERVQLSEVHSAQPRIAPRGDQKKHMIQKNMPKGAHRYDGYSLPIV
jgi:hypothetical protein